MTITFFIITILYFVLIGSLIIGFDQIKEFKKQPSIQTTTFSVVIPFRNEADNLLELLKSLDNLEYPKNLFEVILIDDASEDASVTIIQKVLDTKFSKENFTRTDTQIIKNKRTTNSPKKDAITTAINKAKYDWIVTTDADCLLPKTWLKTFDAFIKNNDTKMIIAPVTYTNNDNFLDQFQLLDLLSLQGATIAGFGINRPFMCNGANLAYKKELFEKLNGFEGNASIASGDDIFLLEKAVSKFPKRVHYLKSNDAIVFTKPEASLTELFQQRLRWASKTSAYNNRFGKIVGLIVLLMNTTIILALVLSVIGSLNWFHFIYIFIIKFVIDFILIYKTAVFFNQIKYLKIYPLSSLVYPFFSVFVAAYSLFFEFKWKERRFTK